LGAEINFEGIRNLWLQKLICREVGIAGGLMAKVNDLMVEGSPTVATGIGH
jgi:hypothetical protein